MISLKELKFVILKYFRSPVISEELSFTSEINKYLAHEIASFNNYLEYGSGSSTIFFSKKAFSVVSVESDSAYAKSVKQIIGQFENNTKIFPSEIGITGFWGYPIFFSRARSTGWKYINTPWRNLGESYTPDVVLIDGRYRVACALNLLLRSANKTKVTIFFDDYVGREEYYFIEKYCKVDKKIDRMAIFEYDLTPMGQHTLNQLKQDLNNYLANPA